ncbi:MAG: hypothetical protein QOH51_121 [Acidobacteriota bacterium]|jgi:pimeloyl-ACP methyl ester carboxylesterase|nr:hypothetical protein [Acidobacteriota bacterium]
MRHTRLSSRLLTILFFFSLLLSAAQNVSAQNCVSAPSGLVGWWTGDGNANDSSGNANNGALQNGAAFATGKVGQSFSFNGDSQYVSIPHSESLNQSQEITVEAWVRLAELPRNVWGTVATKDNPDSGPYHLLIQQDGSVTWEVFTSAWVDINSGQNRITPGEFSHVAGSYKVSTGAFCVYVNGSATCTQLSGSIRTNSNTLKIGGDLYNGRFFKGEIDELSIYNRALSASELQAIFNAGSAGKCKPQVSPLKRPLIFIPGLMGSSLDSDSTIRSNLWPGVLAGQLTDHSILTLDPNKSQTNVIPNDAIGHVASEIIYEPLLNFLKTTGGYHEYVVNGDPTRRTTNGCDLSQQGNNPDLFVFAYDWRFSNAENVAQLKDYVGCIQRFYPGTKVDVLTHSMGGLLARRYIIVNPTDHAVDRLITVAAPWLGAPKAINVMETGEYDGLNRIMRKSTLKSLSEFFPSAHQLLPSRLYFGLGGRPYTKDGTVFADYNQFTATFNAEFARSSPVNAGKTFHDRSGQDDWRTDQSGVKYYHIYGQRHVADTIGSVSNTTVTSRGIFGSKTYHVFNKVLIRGDQTVPILSAERRGIGPGLDLNAPGATLKLFANSDPAADNLFEHTALTQNPSVQSYILSILKPAQSAQPATGKADEEPTVLPAYYVRVVGAGAVTVADTIGNTTNPLADLSDSGVPNVTTFVTGEKATQIVMPADQTFSVTMRADSDPISLEITKGSDIDTSQAIRYQDLSLPTGVTALLRFTPSGIDPLKYDTDGDGTFETTVIPTASASGTSAKDITPPTVSVSETMQQSTLLVTLAASDSESGIKAIYYSTNGSNFQQYTTPFNIDPNQGTVVYVFADDNLANRSSIVTYYPSSTANQVDNAQFFVRQHYLDFLNREPDASGLGFWTNEITSCGSNAQCQEVKRINVSAAFYLSIEFQQTGYLAYRAYKAAFGNIQGKPVPITREEMLSDMQQIGQGVVVGVGDWEQRLEQNKRAFFDQLVTRERFTTSYSQAMTPEQFVDALNANAGGALSQAERDALVNDLKSSAKTRAWVLQAVAEDADLARAETNKAFVLMQYFGYLRRNPNDQPDTDFSGWQFWLSKLDQFNGNFVKAEMVKAFLSSIEYRQRFSAN